MLLHKLKMNNKFMGRSTNNSFIILLSEDLLKLKAIDKKIINESFILVSLCCLFFVIV